MKYKLTDETILIDGRTLHRIECVTAFGCVKVGDKGGWIETEKNLSHDGNAWVSGNAWVYGNALVYGNAKVCGNAWVYGNALVYGNAKVGGNARVCDNAEVCDNALVCGDAWVYGNAKVYGDAWVCDNAEVYGNARVGGNARVCDNAEVGGNARVSRIADYIVFKNNWSSGRYFTYTKSNKMWRVGCFYGTGEELIKKAYADSDNSGKHYEAYVRLVEQLEVMDRL